MLKKNDELIVEILSQDCNGAGVAKVEGEVIFIPGTIAGEKVKIHIINAKGKVKIGKVMEVLTPSASREIPPCPYFGKCGGCDLQHMQYALQCKIKQTMVQDTMRHVGKLDCVVDPCQPSDVVWNYRNKLALPVDPNTRKVSMFASNSHRMIVIDECKIAEDWHQPLIECINTYLEKSNVTIYDETTKRGSIRHVVARCVGDQLLITIVVNDQKLQDQDLLISLLQQHFPVFGLNYNINRKDTNVILGDQFVEVFGPQELPVKEFGIEYTINNACFFQVNHNIKHKIYTRVLEEVKGASFVVDAYSGAGLMTAMMGKVCQEVVGVEIVPDAVESANQLARKHQLSNVSSICGDCAQLVPQVLKDRSGMVVLDPPRKGCDERVLESIILAKAEKIVYISCNPSTLARDLAILSREYKIESITPYDMFPQTKHVETLAILKKK